MNGTTVAPVPVVCVLMTQDDWAPMWAAIKSDHPEATFELLLIDGAPAYPVHGLRQTVMVMADGTTRPHTTPTRLSHDHARH